MKIKKEKVRRVNVWLLQVYGYHTGIEFQVYFKTFHDMRRLRLLISVLRNSTPLLTGVIRLWWISISNIICQLLLNILKNFLILFYRYQPKKEVKFSSLSNLMKFIAVHVYFTVHPCACIANAIYQQKKFVFSSNTNNILLSHKNQLWKNHIKLQFRCRVKAFQFFYILFSLLVNFKTA